MHRSSRRAAWRQPPDKVVCTHPGTQRRRSRTHSGQIRAGDVVHGAGLAEQRTEHGDLVGRPLGVAPPYRALVDEPEGDLGTGDVDGRHLGAQRLGEVRSTVIAAARRAGPAAPTPSNTSRGSAGGGRAARRYDRPGWRRPRTARCGLAARRRPGRARSPRSRRCAARRAAPPTDATPSHRGDPLASPAVSAEISGPPAVHRRGVADDLLGDRREPRHLHLLDVREAGVVEQHPRAEADDGEQHDGADQRRGQAPSPVAGRERPSGHPAPCGGTGHGRRAASGAPGSRRRPGPPSTAAGCDLRARRAAKVGLRPTGPVGRPTLPGGPPTTRPVPARRGVAASPGAAAGRGPPGGRGQGRDSSEREIRSARAAPPGRAP